MKRPLYLKILICIVLFLTLTPGKSQDPYYSQFYNAPLYYNPAMTGLTSGLKVRLMYRNQWPQYNDDLKSYNFSMDVAERFMPGAGGLGIIFNSNQEANGFIKKNMAGAMASARIRMNRNLVAQLGFMGAYVQKRIDEDDFVWSDQLDNRHGLLHPTSSFDGFTSQSVSYADISLGGVIHYQKEYLSMNVGGAIHHVLKPNESFYQHTTNVQRKYILHTDFVILERSNPVKGFKYNPGIMYENHAGFSSFTLGSNIAKSVLYAGMWYRNKQSQIYNYQSLTLLAGINIPMVNKYARMKLMYSYDISLEGMQGTGGTHEITLRFEFDQIHLIKSQDAFANEYPIIYDPVVF